MFSQERRGSAVTNRRIERGWLLSSLQVLVDQEFFNSCQATCPCPPFPENGNTRNREYRPPKTRKWIVDNFLRISFQVPAVSAVSFRKCRCATLPKLKSKKHKTFLSNHMEKVKIDGLQSNPKFPRKIQTNNRHILWRFIAEPSSMISARATWTSS